VAKKQLRRASRAEGALSGGRERVLVVLFVPSVERDGKTPIDQMHWLDLSLEMFGRVFGVRPHILRRRAFGAMTSEAAFL
jgi:hypothetical protein